MTTVDTKKQRNTKPTQAISATVPSIIVIILYLCGGEGGLLDLRESSRKTLTVTRVMTQTSTIP